VSFEPQQRGAGVRDVSAVRNLALLCLVAAVFFGISARSRLDHPAPHTFAAGVDLSMALTLALVGAYLLWGSRFLARNLDRPIGFFRAFDARFAFATTVAFFIVGPALSAISVIAHVSGHPFTSGVLVGPAGLLVLGAFGRATGGVKPL
jgi:hypothetical protein